MKKLTLNNWPNHSLKNGVDNGIRSAGPEYPANCLFPMIHDEIFNVVVLEYYMHMQDGMMQLAKRFRERFPDAIIVIVHHWMPFQVVNDAVFDDRGRPIINLDQYREKMGFDRDYMHNPEFHDTPRV